MSDAERGNVEPSAEAKECLSTYALQTQAEHAAMALTDRYIDEALTVVMRAQPIRPTMEHRPADPTRLRLLAARHEVKELRSEVERLRLESAAAPSLPAAAGEPTMGVVAYETMLRDLETMRMGRPLVMPPGLPRSAQLRVNAARCLKCNAFVVSQHRYDYRRCTCGQLSVDGGLDYTRRGHGAEGYEELSEYVDGARVEQPEPFEVKT